MNGTDLTYLILRLGLVMAIGMLISYLLKPKD